MNQNEEIYTLSLGNILILLKSLSPTVLEEVIFNVVFQKYIEGVKKVWEGEMIIDQIV